MKFGATERIEKVAGSRSSPLQPEAAAFTLIEIAICLGVIAFALVAIIGILPAGLQVQRDNREDTIINQEGTYLLDAIKSGSEGLSDLAGRVKHIIITNVTQGTELLYLTNDVTASTALTPKEV